MSHAIPARPPKLTGVRTRGRQVPQKLPNEFPKNPENPDEEKHEQPQAHCANGNSPLFLLHHGDPMAFLTIKSIICRDVIGCLAITKPVLCIDQKVIILGISVTCGLPDMAFYETNEVNLP